MSRYAWAALVGILAFVLAGTHWKAWKAGGTAVQHQWDRQKTADAMANAQAERVARQTENQLRADADAARKTKNEEIARINRRHAAIVDSLRNRPTERADAGGVPNAPGAGVGCTGEGLAGPDAGFLAGFARDAARLQAAYDECKTAHHSVRQRLLEISGQKAAPFPVAADQPQ